MKKITQYLFIALAIAFANASCNVQKRLHNPGYHVQLNKNVKVGKPVDKILKVEEDLAFEDIKTNETSLPNIEVQQKTSAALNYTKEIETDYTSGDVVSNDESISFHNTNSSKRPLIQEKYSVENQTVIVKEQELDKKAKNNNAANGAGAGGVALLVLIILCLFPLINLIPVYITDSGITLNFWVTLILNLTWIGAVIFSLLVVLGIVSLA